MNQEKNLADSQNYADTLSPEQRQLWQILSSIEDTTVFYSSWLSLLRKKIVGVEAAVVLLSNSADGVYTPVAVWPDPRRDFSFLSTAAETVVTQRQGLIIQPDSKTDNVYQSVQIACPIQRDSGTDSLIQAVVVIDLLPRPERDLQIILQQLQWDCGWLYGCLWQQQAQQNQRFSRRSAMSLDVLAVAAEHRLIEPACMAIANEIAIKLKCDRVAIGLINQRRKSGARIRLRAMSHSAWFRKKTTLVDELENAMEEALDQTATIVFPVQDYAKKRIFVAHKEYAENWKIKHIISFVLLDKSTPVGVITIETRNETPFSEEVLLGGEMIAVLLGPVLDLKRRERRWVSGRIADAVRTLHKKIFGQRYPGLKLLATLISLLLMFILFYPAQFRISADAVLEGISQRASVAPFDGFIESAKVRAGDIVKKNQLLATLDDKDLKIEVLKWQSEQSKLIQEQREALAKKDRSKVALLEAQIRQADSQLSLARLKLARSQIYAPIDGLVISGDLSQKLGAPVQKGETLFKIAPLKAYRVVLKVDERDVRYLKTGYRGTLLLSGMAGESMPLSVVNVTAVSEADEGLNSFRVEARLDTEQLRLLSNIRPGMEGVGKIDISEQSLGWIWTRHFMDWLRMFFWRWIP